jgi:hypothetical protein
LVAGGDSIIQNSVFINDKLKGNSRNEDDTLLRIKA